MIQQSQFLNLGLFEDLNNLFPDEHCLHQEEHKIFQSPTTAPEATLISPSLSRKLKRKIIPDTPKSRKSRGSEVMNPNQKTGHWCLQENKRYHWFLEIHNHHFLHKHMRRMDKIFKTMALFVGTREAEQCRSHHQKMQKKHHSFAKILLSLRRQHYQSHDEQLLLEDLSQNRIDIIDDILLASYLINEEANREILWNPQSLRLQEQDFNEQQEMKNSQQGNSIQQLALLPLNPDGCDIDIVDELLAEQAPHYHYHMI